MLAAEIDIVVDAVGIKSQRRIAEEHNGIGLVGRREFSIGWGGTGQRVAAFCYAPAADVRLPIDNSLLLAQAATFANTNFVLDLHKAELAGTTHFWRY